MSTLLARFLVDETGATAIEYGLISGLIAVAIITSIKRLGGNLSSKFGEISSNLT